MAYSFEHVHIKSKDPRKTAKWWADHFGAAMLPEREVSGGALFCPVEVGGVKINITTPQEHELDAIRDADVGLRYGLEHLGITTDDIDADIARLRAQGLEVFGVKDMPALKVAFVETPDKVRVELMQRKG